MSVGADEKGALGTLAWLPPEALQGARPDPGFDLWSLAVVGFEAVTGRHPFLGGSEGEIWRAIQTGWTPGLAAALSTCPAEVVGLFERALSRNRADRPESASQLKAAIESVLGVRRR